MGACEPPVPAEACAVAELELETLAACCELDACEACVADGKALERGAALPSASKRARREETPAGGELPDAEGEGSRGGTIVRFTRCCCRCRVRRCPRRWCRW
jgi:hypothetical protein